VCCVYSLVTGVGKWLPKWDFTSLHWSHLPEGIRIPFRRYDPSVPFIPSIPVFSLFPFRIFPRATSFEDHPTRSPLRGVMPNSSGSYARKTGLRSHGSVEEQPSAFAGPVQSIPSRVQQSGNHTSPTVPSESSGYGPEPLPMTILPAPTLRVAPDATQKSTPQGDSPALQSTPEITLAEFVEDLAHNLQLCRLQTQEAHLAAQDSLALSTGLRTEVQHLRSQLADLESIVMRELVQDLPIEDLRKKKTKKETPSRNRSKTVSPNKGDVLNRYKTKA
jgi:hypothetical protein